MYIRTKIIKQVTFVYPHVRNLDSQVSLDFARQLREIIQSGRTRKYVINLMYVQTIDSSGLGSLVISRKKAPDGYEIVLVNINRHIDHLFRMIHFDRMFEIFPNEKAAYEYLVAIPEAAMITT